MSVHTINPDEWWKPGDKAYCTVGTNLTSPPLVAGKVYRVESVIPLSWCQSDGLRLREVGPPVGKEGFYSGRFVKLPEGQSALRTIDSHTTQSWFEAYKTNGAKRYPSPA